MPDVIDDPTQETLPGGVPMDPVRMQEDGLSSGLRKRQQRRLSRSPHGTGLFTFIKWMLIIGFGLGVMGVIASPLVYRSLRPEYRERIKHYAPFMALFDPQRAYTADTLPTVAPAVEGGASAADLLLTPEAIMPAGAVDQPASPTPNEDMVIIITATPSPIPTAMPTATSVVTEDPIAVPTATSMPVLPSATSTPLPTPIPPTAIALLPSARLYGFTHIYQTWNNCGPATLTMGLTYYGWSQDQQIAANYLKPDSEDKNVSPGQMVQFVNENTNVRALVRLGGDLDMIRRLVLEGFPVIVETGYMPEGYDWMGHYRLIVAYDDQAQQMYAYDSFLGHGDFQGLPTSYSHFDEMWQHFNRTYIIIYDPAREADLRAVLGDNADLTLNAQHALEVARQEASARPDNPFAWFNMGTSYLALDMYEEAARAYDQARNAGTGLPWRMLWYQFGPFEAYYEVGRYDDVLALVQANLGTTPYVEETYYWTGMVYMAQGKFAPARAQFALALDHNGNLSQARDALVQLDIAETEAANAG